MMLSKPGITGCLKLREFPRHRRDLVFARNFPLGIACVLTLNYCGRFRIQGSHSLQSLRTDAFQAVKRLFAANTFVVAFLLFSESAVGQTVYMNSAGWYDEGTNTVHGYVDMSMDYLAAYYYSGILTATLQVNGNGIDGETVSGGTYLIAYVSAPGQPDTDFLVYGQAHVLAYFMYYDPYFYLVYWYDHGNYNYWGPMCSGLMSTICTGGGPPLWLEMALFFAGEVGGWIHVPPCDYPISMTFDEATTSGLVTIVQYKWRSSLHGDDISGFRACNVKEEVDFTGNPSYPPQPRPFKGWNEDPLPEHYKPNPQAIYQGQGDVHNPDELATPYSGASITGTQNYFFSCPCYNRNAWTRILGPIIMVYKVMSTGGGHWVYEFHKGGSMLNQVPLD